MPPPPHQPQPTTHQPPQPSSAFLSTVLNPNSNTTSTSSTSPSSSTPPRPARTTAHERPPKVFSTTQRSLQARNKEYNILGRDKGESYETRQRREEAGRILESTEMVIWWSAARGEVCSIYLYLYLSLSLSLYMHFPILFVPRCGVWLPKQKPHCWKGRD
jgi:hypothetical protein